MDPYRKLLQSPGLVHRRTFWGALRRFQRFLTIFLFGSFRSRFPDKCPECGKRSWNPIDLRKNSFRHTRTYKLNYWRCGHRYGLLGHVSLQ